MKGLIIMLSKVACLFFLLLSIKTYAWDPTSPWESPIIPETPSSANVQGSNSINTTELPPIIFESLSRATSFILSELNNSEFEPENTAIDPFISKSDIESKIVLLNLKKMKIKSEEISIGNQILPRFIKFRMLSNSFSSAALLCKKIDFSSNLKLQFLLNLIKKASEENDFDIDSLYFKKNYSNILTFLNELEQISTLHKCKIEEILFNLFANSGVEVEDHSKFLDFIEDILKKRQVDLHNRIQRENILISKLILVLSEIKYEVNY